MIRYAILYFILLVIFIALIVGPVVAGKYLSLNFDIPMDLLQPTGLNNNDTSASITGSCVLGECPGGPAADATGSTSDSKLRRFMAF